MSLIIYLNELSCRNCCLDVDGWRVHVKNAIFAIRDACRLRDDIALNLLCPFGGVMFGGENVTFAQLFRGRNNELSILLNVLDRSTTCPSLPNEKDVVVGGDSGKGLGLAHASASFVLSVGHSRPWTSFVISAFECTLSAENGLIESAIDVNNLATPAHVVHWNEKIVNYGRTIAASSLLHRGGTFFVRMHLGDHNPPHVHIYQHVDDTSNCLAKVDIETGDFMSGSLGGGMRREILRFISENRLRLMDGWRRCCAGQLPLEIG